MCSEQQDKLNIILCKVLLNKFYSLAQLFFGKVMFTNLNLWFYTDLMQLMQKKRDITKAECMFEGMDI